MRSYDDYSKVVLNDLICDQLIPRLIRLVVFIIWTNAKLLSITLWLVYDCVKVFLWFNVKLQPCDLWYTKSN